MTATIDRTFGESLLRTVDDPARHGVHLLFNEFWRHAPDEVGRAYAERLAADEAVAAWLAEAHYPDPPALEALGACAPGTLGAEVHRFVVDNGLQVNLATDYRAFHRALEDAGALDGMPEPLRYAVLRGFQLHDFLHVVTGYTSSPLDELSLQAFCLAQLQFPYFAMWMSVVTARMTFLEPRSIVPVMDAVTAGWSFGRSVGCIQLERWEDRVDEPLAELRRSVGIDPGGRRAGG